MSSQNKCHNCSKSTKVIRVKAFKYQGVTIDEPGSYCLEGNVNFGLNSPDAITITASDVFLDLNRTTLSTSGFPEGSIVL